MNLQSFKQRLSLRNLSESLLRVIRRFPVTSVFLFLVTAILSYLLVTETEPGRVGLCVLAFMLGGGVISLATSLWGEEQRDKRKRWIVEGVLLTVCAVYCVLLFLTDLIPGRGLPAFTIANMAWMLLVVVLIPFGAFLKEENDLKAWHFILSLCGALLISGLATWVMLGGLEGLVFGTAALFDFDAGKKLPVLIMIVCEVLLFGILFLALVPHSERKHNASADMPSFLTKIVSWLLLPLLGCYILVLYVYGINILVHWELPKGMISWLVSAVMGAYILCYVLIYPQVTNTASWQSKVLTRWLPMAILPLLVLMSVGVVRRFADYGITPPRLYLLTLLLWFYAVCIVMLVVPRKRFRWIALSFVALLILSSGHPLNYYRLCRPVLTAKIDKMIAEHDEELEAELRYMRDCYGKEYTSRWVEQYEPVTSDEDRELAWKIDYYKPAGGNLCPQGYHRFNWIDRQTEYLPEKVTKDSLHEGILHVPYQGTVLLFDTAAIRKAKKDAELLLIPSQDEQNAFSVQSIYMKAYNDGTINVSYSGYVFHN